MPNSVISSSEIKIDTKVGPTCVVYVSSGAQLSFRLVNGQPQKVAWQGYVTKEEFLAARNLAGQKICEAMKVEVLPSAKHYYSLAGARAHARAINPHEADD